MNRSVSAEVHMHRQKCDLFYDDVQMVSATVSYPEAVLAGNEAAQNRINRCVCAQAENFCRDVSGRLYCQAIKEYLASQEQDFPFRMFGAGLDYNISYNRDCHFSVYRDRYEYTGGAHGLTVRDSDTWSLETGCRLPLSSFFCPGEDYRETVLAEIIRQADLNMQQNPGIYFDDYRNLIRRYFDPEHFYLTPDGAAVYFQQYEIAPYAAGIIIFIVPYGAAPCCRWCS